jgi:hypothetical protein
MKRGLYIMVAVVLAPVLLVADGRLYRWRRSGSGQLGYDPEERAANSLGARRIQRTY